MDMASVLIRNIDDDLKSRLRVRAAEHGRSMEEEARAILSQALAPPTNPTYNLVRSIRAKFEPLGGVDLEIPPREMPRDPPDFS
jgi:plasmid stability protein